MFKMTLPHSFSIILNIKVPLSASPRRGIYGPNSEKVPRIGAKVLHNIIYGVARSSLVT